MQEYISKICKEYLSPVMLMKYRVRILFTSNGRSEIQKAAAAKERAAT